jgi:transcriptional regulator with GAF, ATPase, and Fis domain
VVGLGDESGVKLMNTDQAIADGSQARDASGVNEPVVETETVADLIQAISSRFINLPAGRIDGEISGVLKTVSEVLDLDRSTIGQYSLDGRAAHATHYYHRAGIAPPPPAIPTEMVPWLMHQLRLGRTVVLERLPQDLPEEAALERALVVREGLRSCLCVPLRINGEVVAGLAFSTFRASRTWSPKMVATLQLLGDILANALARKRADDALQDRLKFERLLAEVSARFTGAPAREIDAEITRAVHRVGDYMACQGVAVAQFCSGHSAMRTTHHFVAPGAADPPKQLVVDQTMPWLAQRLVDGLVTVCSMAPDDLPDEAEREKDLIPRLGIRSFLAVPLRIAERTLGMLTCVWTSEFRKIDEELSQAMRLLGETIANALDRKRASDEFDAALSDIRQLKDRLHAENAYLREEIQLQQDFGGIIGQSDALQRVLRQVQQVAATDSSVLIMGETGTGKELLARAIHAQSRRQGRAMIKVNCAALPATLIEAELFGREKGAYTGALTQQLGRFELADHSTLFLDEIAELPLEMQVKFLRVLQEAQFERLGSGKTITADVRIIAATNRDLKKSVADGLFRSDLYYRLNVFPIVVPPLRERRADIPQLVWAFVQEFSERMGKPISSIPKSTMEALQSYFWPGNVRELRNVIERAMILAHSDRLTIDLPDQTPSRTDVDDVSLDGIQRRHILQILEQTGFRIRGTSGAAELLGVKPTTLESRMSRLGITRTICEY